MISAYVGLPGSGKSYQVVAHVILPAIKAGRAVRTNIPLQLDAIREEYPEADVEILDIERFKADNPSREDLHDFCPPGALVALDELWRLWPAGMKTAAVPEEHKAFLAEHRHRVGPDGRASDVILVTQDLSQIAAFARALVDKTYIAQKLDGLGAKRRAKVNIYQGAVTGHRGPKAQHLRTTSIRYQPELWRYYKSHTKSETGAAGDEVTTDGRSVIWRSPAWMALGLGVFLVAPLSFCTAKDSIENPAGIAAASEPTPTPAPQVIRVEAPPQPVRATPPPIEQATSQRGTSEYRLVGYVTKAEDGSGLALIRNAVGYIRLYIDACERVPNSPDLQCMHEGKQVQLTSGYSYLSGKRYNTQ